MVPRPIRSLLLAAAAFLAVSLVVPALTGAAFTPPITITPSGADPFGYPSHVGFSRSGETTVETVSGGNVLVYTRPPGGSFSGGAIGSGTRASLAESPSGAAVIAWAESASTVRVAYRAGAGASFAATAAFPGTAVTTVAAGIDANGNAVVAWKDGGIHYALSTGSVFGPAQTAPLGAAPGFEGKGSDPQRDRGPRAFRDNSGDVALVYRDGSAATLAQMSPAGAWTKVVLPGGDTSTDISADADPTSQHLIVGYTTATTFLAFVGSTTSTSGSIRVRQPAASASISAVAVRPTGSEDLALWRDNTDALRSASCLEDYSPTRVAASVGGGVLAAVTAGSEELAYYPGGGFARSSRAPGGTWTTNTFAAANFGTIAAGSGYSGEALGLFVDFPSDTGITGFPYTGTATPQGTCAVPPVPVTGKTFNVIAIKRPVLVRAPGSKRFVALTHASQLRFGAVVDSRRGRARITIVSTKGKLDISDFYGGQFAISQLATGARIATLVLAGGSFSGCPTAPRRPHLARKKPSLTQSIRHLWGDGDGKFRTVGRFSAATIRGTQWLTDDRCGGTLTRVTRGAVSVRDFVKRRTVVVRAGHQYLAQARRK